MRTPPTAAVIGTGFIGPVHVEALRRAGVHVAGIVGSTPAKSAAAADSLGLPGAYRSLGDVLADRSVDCVHITTPNRLHYEQTKAVLAAGKHVVCEKPLAMDSVQTAELVRLADESGLAAAVAYNIRFYPLCHHAAAMMGADEIGDCLHVTGSYVQDWLLQRSDYNWRVSASEGGPLRAVADIGTHWLDLVQFITGRAVVSVCTDLQIVHPHRDQPTGDTQTFSADRSVAPSREVDVDTEDAGNILLKFSGGGRGVLHVSQTTAGRKNCLRWEIAGTRRALAWNSQQPNELWIGRRDGANEMLVRDPASLHPTAAAISQYPGGHNEGFPDTFKQLFRTFYAHIQGGGVGQGAYPTFADGHREVQLCEAILQSHRRRAWVDVPENS